MSEQATRQATKSASVKYGPHQHSSSDIVGRTVAEVREELAPQWRMDTGADAYMNKQQLKDDHVIQPGEAIHFFRPHGEKG